MGGRHIGAVAPAHGMADQHGLLPAELVHDRDDVGREILHLVGFARTPGRVAETAHVDRHDLAVGISGAVEKVIAHAAVGPSSIKLVSMSTTLATNALVEGQGGRVALVMIGFLLIGIVIGWLIHWFSIRAQRRSIR